MRPTCSIGSGCRASMPPSRIRRSAPSRRRIFLTWYLIKRLPPFATKRISTDVRFARSYLTVKTSTSNKLKPGWPGTTKTISANSHPRIANCMRVRRTKPARRVAGYGLMQVQLSRVSFAGRKNEKERRGDQLFLGTHASGVRLVQIHFRREQQHAGGVRTRDA